MGPVQNFIDQNLKNQAEETEQEERMTHKPWKIRESLSSLSKSRTKTVIANLQSATVIRRIRHWIKERKTEKTERKTTKGSYTLPRAHWATLDCRARAETLYCQTLQRSRLSRISAKRRRRNWHSEPFMLWKNNPEPAISGLTDSPTALQSTTIRPYVTSLNWKKLRCRK